MILDDIKEIGISHGLDTCPHCFEAWGRIKIAAAQRPQVRECPHHEEYQVCKLFEFEKCGSVACAVVERRI